MRKSPRSYQSGLGRSDHHSHQAFTLVELLAVLAIIVLIMALAGPALNALKGSGDVNKSAYDVAGAIETARAYAIANNTYTWVGFYEEDAGTLIPTKVSPPYTGKGQLVIGIVYSKDGTTNCMDTSSTSANPKNLIPARIGQLGKIIKIENVHMTDVGAPVGGPGVNSASLDGRPDVPYTYGSPFEYLNRINSDDTHSPTNTTLYPFAVQGYTFYKTVMFNPRGESKINSTYGIKHCAEIGLVPTHGTVPDASSKNVAAIQFTGIGGNVKIYRR